MRREKFIGEDEIKHLFQDILGTNINIKDNLKQTEETVFCLFVKKLEESRIIEDKVFEEAHIDLKRVTDPLWLVVENLLKMQYGPDAVELIMWYIYERFNPEGKVMSIEDENGKKYKFLNPKDLFSYIKHRHPKS